MEEARERIIFPLDLPSKEEAIDFVRLLKGYVGCFKVGLELFISEGPEILRVIAQETDTPIFLDLKLHDIPQTMKRAYRVACRYGPKFITVHCYEGNGLFEELTQDPLHPKILSVTLLTSMNEDNLRELGYRDEYKLYVEVYEEGEIEERYPLIGEFELKRFKPEDEEQTW